MNPTLDLLRSHRTVRKFRAEELDRERIVQAVSAAQFASTSSNVQAYSLIHVRDAHKRAALVELTGGQPQVADAGAFFVVCGDQRRHRRVAERSAQPYAPNLETFLVAVIDASLFAQNLTVAFESMGLGVCYIGGLRNQLAKVDALLELPSDVLPLYGLCVGEPAEDPGQRPRLPVEAVLFDDAYPDDAALDDWIDRYDETTAAYYEQRGKPGHNWTGALWRKFAEPRRQHLADYYRTKGGRLE